MAQVQIAGRIESRVTAYWDRQASFRGTASCRGILASNVANNGRGRALPGAYGSTVPQAEGLQGTVR